MLNTWTEEKSTWQLEDVIHAVKKNRKKGRQPANRMVISSAKRVCTKNQAFLVMAKKPNVHFAVQNYDDRYPHRPPCFKLL